MRPLVLDYGLRWNGCLFTNVKALVLVSLLVTDYKGMANLQDMSHLESQRPDFRNARHPSRMYSGACDGGKFTVSVLDSALPQDETNPRPLAISESRKVQDCCESYHWGDESNGARQLAVALLLDVTGDPDSAKQWFEFFACRYVANLGQSWNVPELDIALWLHCYQNARPGS